ncbi:hypothetical protein [Streptomyces noursei]|uniref:hypothetical protein n=1 Tax=Streptomyces noursei TaxID=1971 RepID=UPI00045EE304|nr:hypothetical protein [Streptomyces noursei]AIA03834.1 hypothetical protein DC74_3337 [Streptomyces noursei]
MARPHRHLRPRRPTATVRAALAAASIALPLLTACGTVQRAVDCTHTATALVDGVDTLRTAADHATDDPQQATKALDTLDADLHRLSASTDDPELAGAVDTMSTGIKNARQALADDEAPDLTPIGNSLGRITSACTPGDEE